MLNPTFIRFALVPLILGGLSSASPAADRVEKTNQLASVIHQANVKEIELGQLAGQKGQHQNVKEFAKQMIAAHQDADQKLAVVATSENLTLEPKKEAKAAEQREKLMGKTGIEFDKEYISCMIDKHRKLLSKLKGSQGWLPDGSVKSLTQELIPIVEHHLMMAKQIEEDLKKSK